MIKVSDLVIDHELKEFLPRGSQSERSELLANIRADGRMISPIIVWLNHGIIVDGQTRFDIWRNELASSEEFEPQIVEKHFASKDEVKAWMIRHQSGRRNWDPSQRALMAAELSFLTPADGAQHCAISVAAAAKEQDVSPRLVTQARKVVKDGAPSLKRAVMSRQVTVSDAAKVAKLPKAKQNAAVHAVANGTARTVAASIDPEQERLKQLLGKSATKPEPTAEEDGPDRSPPKTIPRITSNGNLGLFDAASQRKWRDAYGTLHRMNAEFKKNGNKTAFAKIDAALGEYFKLWTANNPGTWS